MATLEVRTPYPNTTTTIETHISATMDDVNEDELSPVEQVRLTVPNIDDPTLPVWTFRMWTLGLLLCAILSFLNQFFSYRIEPLLVSQITVSEHVLNTIFTNVGTALGNEPTYGVFFLAISYGVYILDIIKAFYHRNISFFASWLLIVTTQVLGYGWAGLLRKYVVELAHMRWPASCNSRSSLTFSALQEKEEKRFSGAKFFLIALICRFTWYTVPGYLFSTLTNISWQIGSGMKGLGLGAVALDWAAVSSFLFSPLISPSFSIMNVFAGYVLMVYIAIPIAYWGLDLYNASRFPIFSSQLFTSQGQHFELDLVEYEKQGPIHLSMFFALTYGFGFATIVATLTHVTLFYGRFQASYKGMEGIHTKLMRKYKDIPSWWFYLLLIVTLAVSLVLCTVLNDQVQLPWWGLLFASAIAYSFTLPIRLNSITEYIMGLIYPGRPIANVSFKVYGYMAMNQAVSFLNNFKFRHYMKIPPRSMFLLQFIGTILAGTINIGVARWLLNSIQNICQPELLPVNSPWTCPSDRVFFDASVIWGAIGPVIVWLLHNAFPKQTWIPLINLPSATPLNYNVWIAVGTIFNYFVYRYRKEWWQSATVFSVGMEGKGVNWWGTEGEHCGLAVCPTAEGIVVDACPVK
ncbi:hypothetical protein ACJW30_07G076200 [Castanea mollissima]